MSHMSRKRGEKQRAKQAQENTPSQSRLRRVSTTRTPSALSAAQRSITTIETKRVCWLLNTSHIYYKNKARSRHSAPPFVQWVPPIEASSGSTPSRAEHARTQWQITQQWCFLCATPWKSVALKHPENGVFLRSKPWRTGSELRSPCSDAWVPRVCMWFGLGGSHQDSGQSNTFCTPVSIWNAWRHPNPNPSPPEIDVIAASGPPLTLRRTPYSPRVSFAAVREKATA